MRKVKNYTNLRKTSGGTVVNVSSTDYDKYMRRKELALEEKQRIDSLEKDVSEIKGMLRQILDKV